MHPKSYSLASLAAAAVLAIVLSACDSGESPAAAATDPGQDAVARQQAFEKDIADLKARERDPVRFDLGVQEALLRHGYPVPEAARPHYGLDGVAAALQPSPAALGKAAATTAFNAVRWDTCYAAPTASISVPANATLEAWTTHTGSADPMLVGFYRTSGVAGDLSYTTRDVGVGDDENGGLDAYWTWQNTTGTSQTVYLVAFAYNENLGGDGAIYYRVVGRKTYSVGNAMRAFQARLNQYAPTPSGCTGPVASLLSLTRDWGVEGAYSVLAVNRQTHRGGFVTSATNGIFLEDVLPRDNYSFILGYASLGGFTPASGYYGRQVDAYSCP